MYTHHRFDHEYPPGTDLQVAYLICAIPRSGSSYLAELLFQTGLAGAPTEYFDATQAAQFAATWGVTGPDGVDGVDGYLNELRRRKTGPNGVLGLKAHHHQLDAVSGLGHLRRVFPDLRPVAIRRRDRISQAVSYSIAVQTGQWASTHATGPPPRYSHRHILRHLRLIEAEEHAWEESFATFGDAPFTVDYEDLVADPGSVIVAVLDWLGLDPTAASADLPTLTKQGGERNQEWADRFRRRHER